MRKISKLAARAFIEGREFRRDNTSVTHNKDPHDPLAMHMQLRLHGNLIADWTNMLTTREKLRITLAGWPTVTTRERLNGLLTEICRPEGFWQRNYEQYYGTLKNNRVVESSEWIIVPTVCLQGLVNR